jgi:4-amino-4-deoxy-L-arabinose transferase-like glycosyltransferase
MEWLASMLLHVFRTPLSHIWAGGLAIGVLALAIFFGRLNYPLLEPDEGRYAEIPLLMCRADNYAIPQLQGRPYFDKPPLVYWLVAGSYHVFGVSPWSARLVPALCAWLTVLATYLWLCRQLGLRAALLGAAALCTSLGFARFGRIVLPDGPLTLSVVLALWTGYHAIVCGPRRGWWLASGACCGAGILAKGPVALVVVLPCLAALPWLRRGVARTGWREWAIYIGAAATVAAPWFLWANSHMPGFTEEFFWRHNLVRFTAPFQHQKDWWYYALVFPAELLPWTPALFGLIYFWRRRRRLPAPVLYCLVATSWPILFFSISGCKTPAYLVPAIPPAACVTGYVFHRFLYARWARAQWPATWRPLLAYGICGCGVVIFWVWKVIPDHARCASTGRPAARIARLAAHDDMPVVAFRGTWDAAGFYRGGTEIPVVDEASGPTLATFLSANPHAWVLARDYGNRSNELYKALPSNVEVERTLDCGPVIALRVARHVVPPLLQ